MLRRLSLRSRLVLGAIVLSALALGAANVATYTSLHSFLVDRTDATLRESTLGAARELRRGCPHDDGRPRPGAAPGDYVEVRASDGTVLCSYQAATFLDTTPPPPDLPEEIDAAPVTRDGTGGAYFTTGAVGGDDRYRVRAISDSNGTTLIVATSLADLDATLRRLLGIELLVTLLALGALAGVALWVVRLGLRPLDEIGATAAAIAAGDLTRRVERAEPRTEVGRLGLALNAMLGRIENAFHAQAASERKLRRFVADASHELRTPLAAVRAYAELFDRGADRRPDDLARSMQGVVRESERMSMLVDDLLLLARLDEGRPLDREEVRLDEVVTEAVDAARAVDPQRDVALDAGPAIVLGDRDRIRQLVDSLLANVRAHTPAGAPASVRVGRENGTAIVEVADSGPGIADGDAARVFERFY